MQLARFVANEVVDCPRLVDAGDAADAVIIRITMEVVLEATADIEYVNAAREVNEL